MGFSPGDAEDLTQDVFVTFFETIERFEGRSEVGTWLFGILYRKGKEHRRAQAREALSDALDEAFEARFNANGSWRQPPIPADRLVAAAKRLLRSETVSPGYPHSTVRSFSCGKSMSSPPPMSAECWAARSTMSASCFTAHACGYARAWRRRAGGDHNDDV
jgi:hypothetical protein